MDKLDPDDSRQPYVQIAVANEHAIAAREFSAGERLPSRSELAAWFDVAPMTIQNAWTVLRERGVIVSRQGSGVFVTTDAQRKRIYIAELEQLRERVADLERVVAELEEPAGDDAHA